MRHYGYVLFALTALLLVLSGLRPHDRFTWWLEAGWVMAGLVIVALLWIRRVRMSPLLKVAAFLHAVILLYGAAYTYELVPLGEWMKEWFAWDRNHYDRIGHFAQGFFPVILYREVLVRYEAVNGRAWRETIVFGAALAFTAIFELLEFGTALALGATADAFLGSQGDIWDAQWDMLFCGIGAAISIVFLAPVHYALLRAMRERRGSWR
jgi:putative membrane protein